MSIFVKSKLITWIVSNWKISRIINSAIILFAFFTPWFVDFDWYKTDWYHNTGFGAIMFFRNMGVFEFELEKSLSGRIGIAILAFPYFLGLIALLIYCVLNMFAAISMTNLTEKLNWRILISCLLVLGAISLLKILNMVGTQHLSSLQWGYWIGLIGFISSVVLEISCFISKGA
jgi:hypothetical protein